MEKREKRIKLVYYLMVCFIVISITGGAMLVWFNRTFGITLSEILYTIGAPLQGADYSFLLEAITVFLVSATISVVMIIVLKAVLFPDQEYICNKLRIGKTIKKYKKKSLVKGVFVASLLFFVGIAVVIIEADQTLQITSFITRSFHKTNIYETYYIQPNIPEITSNNRRNLVYIYLESMETTYASKEEGGKQNNNYIPHLTELARNDISFSNTEKLGGFHCTTGSGWTMGAIFSAEAGIPFAFPINGNDMEKFSEIATGTIVLGDILEQKGYTQEFLCGSDATFAGKRTFFEQHGNYIIYDLDSAISDGLMTEEHQAFWGFDDEMLYQIAKSELTELATSSQPFNFTMLTVDTHHVDGWICGLCEDTYPEQLANVLCCADNQIYNFLEWCSEQDWYENTTIVLQGDHPRMDQSLVESIDYYDRTIYNCFINTEYDREDVDCDNREFTPFDMFSTVLASIGFSIPGNRLGLGVNLFSKERTLAEELGIDYIETEVSKGSDYYKRFY